MQAVRTAAVAASTVGLMLQVGVGAQQPGQKPPPQPMGFFITSAGPGAGGNLGGLDGADKHCQTLAAAAGSKRTWRAYLSTQPAGGQPGVNARDRIGSGPWYNAKGQLIAANVADLHGRVLLGAPNTTTCDNWTSNADTSRAMLGHHDRLGGANASWNAVHLSAGCSQEALVKTGGAGLFYCFATN